MPLTEETDLDGKRLQRRRLVLCDELPWGYHRLELLSTSAGDLLAAASLVITPGRCWLPPVVSEGKRLWGIAAQLYLLRSATDWGIGDFGDLRSLVELAAAHGADLIGLNPLHAMFHDNPTHASPYSPASRLLLNILNIDVLAVPELLDCQDIRDLIASQVFRERLDACRTQHLVDYDRVTDLKLDVLASPVRSLPPRCRQTALAGLRDVSPRASAKCWSATACFWPCASTSLRRNRPWPTGTIGRRNIAIPPPPPLPASRRSTGTSLNSWPGCNGSQTSSLPPRLAPPRSAGHGEWGCIATSPWAPTASGAETWANPGAVVSGAQVGAPPDIHNPAGQDWGLPPFHPRALREEGYRSFIELVRANMRHAGGLRIDHVMGLQHLYWVPQGQKPHDGRLCRLSDART